VDKKKVEEVDKKKVEEDKKKLEENKKKLEEIAKVVSNINPRTRHNVREVNRTAVTYTNWLIFILILAISFLAVSRVK